MPRSGSARIHTCTRLTQEMIDTIDEFAKAEGLVKDEHGEPNRSAMIRRLLAEALEWRKESSA